MYAHIVGEITEGATSRSCCKPSKPPSRRNYAPVCGRVTTRTGFAAEGSGNALVLENTKIITVWNVSSCRTSKP